MDDLPFHKHVSEQGARAHIPGKQCSAYQRYRQDRRRTGEPAAGSGTRSTHLAANIIRRESATPHRGLTVSYDDKLEHIIP